MPSERARGAALFLLAALGAAPGRGAEVLLERIVAVVDGRPLMLSEVRVLRALQPQEETRAVEALVDEHLMYREAVRVPRARPSSEELETAAASLGPRLPGVSAEAVERVARRQLTVLRYIELRFRPQVRLEDAEALPAEERARRERAELDRRIEAWVAELRAGADVRRRD